MINCTFNKEESELIINVLEEECKDLEEELSYNDFPKINNVIRNRLGKLKMLIYRFKLK